MANPLLIPLLAGLAAMGGCGSQDCQPGDRACECLDGDSCRLPTLSCHRGTCVPSQTVCEGGSCIPSEPKCYSPCAEDLVEPSGKVRVCSREGLLDGCVAGQACDQGSCVPQDVLAQGLLLQECTGDTCVQRRGLEGETLTEDECVKDPRCCLDAAGCPDHQVCIRGGCYSDCEEDRDCLTDGARCLKHACRLSCVSETGDATPCPAGQVCSGTGYCQPQAAAGAPIEIREGDFAVAVAGADEEAAGVSASAMVQLAFGPSRTSGRFEVRNEGDERETFLVRKSVQWVMGEGGEPVMRCLRS